MESNTETVKSTCSSCGKDYAVEVRAEESCKDYIQEFERSMQLMMANRKKCDVCIEAEELAEAKQQALIRINEKLRAIPFSTDFNRSKAIDGGLLAEWIWINRNKHLWISGDYGCGKTRALCNTLGQLTRQGRKCKYITCNDLLSKYSCKSQESGKVAADKWLESLLQVDFLGIDDIGKKKISLSGGEGLYNLLDYRYSGRGKATIYLTANLSGSEIERKFEDVDTGAAFRSRLFRLEFLPWKSIEKYVESDIPETRLPYKDN